MATIDQAFPSKHLRASDLEHPLAVRIQYVANEKVGQEQEAKFVCHFVGEMKPLILNKTNFAALVTITGKEDSDEWSGAQVELVRESILMRGERTPAVRIRPIRNGNEPHGDDIPTTWGDEPVVSSAKKKRA
jgi:hypothetical protein